jgi:uncharacterized protein YbaR (Trm112 family)
MSLISCPECSGKLSTAAEACPHCGHPTDLITRPQRTHDKDEDDELVCYACERTATTKCQECGALSCLAHIHNSLRSSDGLPLRCAKCFEAANKEDTAGCAVMIALAIIGFIVLMVILSAANQQRHFPQGPAAPHHLYG